jgi:hypothetical protein
MDIKFRIQRCLEWSENWRVINHAEMLAPSREVTIRTPVGVAISHDRLPATTKKWRAANSER